MTLFWILLLSQIAMGAFDTIYHHELTQRLAWRASQAHELACMPYAIFCMRPFSS
jgi:hypothetical protein